MSSPPDDPDSLMPLPIYRKSLRLIQKEYKQGHVDKRRCCSHLLLGLPSLA